MPKTAQDYGAGRLSPLPVMLGEHRVVFALLCAGLFVAPLPLGSNRPLAWSAMQWLGFGACAYLCLRHVWRPERVGAGLRRARPVLFLFGAWLALQGIQCLPLPAEWLQGLSPGLAEIHAQDALPERAQASLVTLSLVPGDSLRELLKHGAYFAWLVALLWTTTSRRRVEALILTVVLAAGLNATLAVLAHYSALPQWSVAVEAGNSGAPGGGGDIWARGTYANRNHFAALMSMGALLTGAMLARHLGRRPGRGGLSGRMLSGTELLLGPASFWVCLLVLLLAGLLLSGSRGGGVALLAAGVCAAWLSWLRPSQSDSRNPAARRSLPVLGGITLAIGVTVAWVGAGSLGDRLDGLGLESNRWALFTAVAPMLELSPWVGSGGGSFQWLFPAYKDAAFGAGNLGYVYVHAHNDFLEAAVEFGLLGCALLGAAAFVVVRTGWQTVRRRSDGLARACAVGGTAGVIALLVHGLVDFNFHIPANALCWYALLALIVLSADLERPPSRRERASGARRADSPRAGRNQPEAST